MKRHIILTGAVAIALTSCSNDEIKDVNPGKLIDFQAAVDTRAAETTTANLNEFQVTALDSRGDTYFNDVTFTKGGSNFSSEKFYYWPADKALTFYAYSPSANDLEAAITINNTTKSMTGFTVNATIADQQDFITAVKTVAYSEEQNTPTLEFSHKLSQIEIWAKNENDSYVYKVKGIKIGQPVAAADFDFSSDSWTLKTDKAKYSETYETAITLSSEKKKIMGSGGNAMLIPQQLTPWDYINDKTNTNTGAYLSVYVNIQTSEGTPIFPAVEEGETEPYSWVAVPVDTNWEAGIKYVYTLDFTGGAGVIDPDEEGAGESVLGESFKFQVNELIGWGDLIEL